MAVGWVARPAVTSSLPLGSGATVRQSYCLPRLTVGLADLFSFPPDLGAREGCAVRAAGMDTQIDVNANPRWGLSLFLAIAPAASVLLALPVAEHTNWMAAAPVHVWVTVLLFVWSPLPISLPAIILESERDAALPGYSGLGRVTRAVLFVPHMLTRSTARIPFAASLIGFGLAIAAALPLLVS